METLLTVTNVTKNHDMTRALKGVSFEIARGEVVGLVGENGAGKSTLLSILGGWTAPTSGSMELDGEPYAPQSPEEALACGVGSIQQKFVVDPDHTVAQNIFRASFHADKSPEEQRERARELLESSGLDFDPDARMGDLVRAEQALVEVVRLIAEETQLVLMDEVAATFNDFEIAQFHQITRRLVREGRSVIYITHRIDEISSLVGRVIVLREGLIAREFHPRAMPATEIAYEITQRELVFGRRPDEFEDEHTRLYVEHLSTPDGHVRDVTLALRRGEIFGLTGLRRAGMTELASALVGVTPATWSAYRIDGADVEVTSPADALSHGIGYLSDRDDELGITTEESIAKNLLDGRVAMGFREEVAALREVVAQVQKLRIRTTDIQSDVGKLSGGNQQKIALARWMGSGCEILILNHPTRGIDVGARQDIGEMLKELAQRGTTIVLISSDMSELLELCNRTAVMRDGVVVSVQDNAESTEDTLMREALGVMDEPSEPRQSRRGERAAV
ncbi:sugar ABC transporter ATP-binding protein [Pseudoclavibacter chungangensis]|uniref:Sugar ABC transporter ATP-binding protein n=1 Tax=Pseudoclavibacter chungangensis TaxID=587635 RepID=A0A7J5BQ92_9MICO|nr:sugar ABC transporter ATP-binding protein [Pseudoclavibacter chungangensis]KAB1655663.1 sugar ABC transporter ATP-binding protein [Pseudoclavibacter chungangensis]NYJ67929.1 ribose transport system ATP-binding protein [Pseudoclavibacter chungangensis]